jgi:hypothetical protein
VHREEGVHSSTLYRSYERQGIGLLVKPSLKENRGMATGRSRGRQGKEAPEKKRKCVLIIG